MTSLLMCERLVCSPWSPCQVMAGAAVDGGARTKVEIGEEGWRDNQAALDASYGNCMGWAQMLAALKVWVEHGINLREGMYA